MCKALRDQRVTGFDQTGRIVCGVPGGGTGTPGGGSPPTPLPNIADFIVSGLTALVGNEFPSSSSISGPITGTINFLGFAFCSPPNPSAPPAASPPIYGCSPNVQATASTDGSSLSVTVQMAHLFGDGSGQVTIPIVGTRSITGFVLLSNVAVSATAPLVDAGGGLKTFGPVSQFSFKYSASDVDIDGLGSVLGGIVDLVSNFVFSMIVGTIGNSMETELNNILATVPPFSL